MIPNEPVASVFQGFEGNDPVNLAGVDLAML